MCGWVVCARGDEGCSAHHWLCAAAPRTRAARKHKVEVVDVVHSNGVKACTLLRHASCLRSLLVRLLLRYRIQAVAHRLEVRLHPLPLRTRSSDGSRQALDFFVHFFLLGIQGGALTGPPGLRF